MNIDMTMFHQAFFEEASDLLSDLESLLLRLEETPEDKELLNTIFRCAHSIKGGSATFGFADVAHFTHGLETLLDLLRNGQMKVTTRLTQLLLESLDQLKMLGCRYGQGFYFARPLKPEAVQASLPSLQCR